MRRPYKIALLIISVLGVYYPSLFSGFNLVDDPRFVAHMESMDRINIAGLFLSDAAYYRPLTVLTFYFDKAFWGLEPSFMHLENIVLHALNALLVFLIAERIFRDRDSDTRKLPLFCGLLFALHPINTESVNWLSGRTDVLATNFVLAAALALLYGVDSRRYRYVVFSSVLIFIGSLAKETALFFYPASIALYWYYSSGLPERPEDRRPHRGFSMTALSLAFALGFIAYFLLRFSLSRTDNGGGIGAVMIQLVPGSSTDIAKAFMVSLKAFGFYVKKLFVPVPLNFAIVKVGVGYMWFGIIALIATVLAAMRRNILAGFFVTSLFLISSAILIIFSGIAWTPIAERYLYLSSSLFAIAAVGGFFEAMRRFQKVRWTLPIIMSVFVISAVVTVDRNLVWADNKRLYEDTMRKSPQFAKIKNGFAAALIEEGRFEEADAFIDSAIRETPSVPLLYVNKAKIKLDNGNLQEAREIIQRAYVDKKTANTEVLKMLAIIDERRLCLPENNRRSHAIAREIIDTLDHIYRRNHEPINLYRAGQHLLFIGDQKTAGEYFERAYSEAPEGVYYRAAAKKLSEKFKDRPISHVISTHGR